METVIQTVILETVIQTVIHIFNQIVSFSNYRSYFLAIAVYEGTFFISLPVQLQAEGASSISESVWGTAATQGRIQTESALPPN